MNARVGNLAGRGAMGQKHPPAVSKRIRDSACGEECALRLPCCNRDDATTVFAHIRQFSNAGISEKPPDYWGVYACSDCHDQLDRRAGDAEWGWDDVLRALSETQRKLSRKGLLVTK